jgi:type IV secretory pathway VirD2 relaxase
MTTALRTTLNALTLGLALAAAACTPRVRGPVEPREDTSGSPQINLTDRELQDRLAVRAPIVSQDEAGLLHVTVPVRNTTSRQMTVQYRVTFFDRNRSPIQETTWFDRTMSPHTQQTITFNSTSPRADDFQVDVRPAK